MTLGIINLPQKMIFLLELPSEVRGKLGFQVSGGTSVLSRRVCSHQTWEATLPLRPSEATASVMGLSLLLLCSGIVDF